MRRTTTITMLIGLMLGALAGPALGQPYPPPPRVNVTTPGSTITITGDDWGPGTTVTITAHQGSQSSTSGTTTTATVADDGTFEAPVRVPETGSGDEFLVEVAGTDATGAQRTETRLFAVSSSANAGAAALEEEPGGITPLHVLLAGVLVAAAAVLLRRRATMDD